MKARLKLALLWLLRSVGAFALARWLTRRAVMIVGWHGVSVEREHERFPSLFISPESLRQRLAFLARHYTVIDLDELARQHAEGRFEPRQVVLTFDDGMENFHDVAAPLLRERSMTATNYVVSEFLESKAPNYRMVVRDVVRRRQPGSYPAVLPGGTPIPSGARQAAVEALAMQEFDRLGDRASAKAEYTGAFARALKVDLAQIERDRTWHSMTPDTLRTLAQEGFSLQLHTHSHVNVVDHAAAAPDEVRVCRQAVEGATGYPAAHFCYPSGRWTRAAWPVLEKEGIKTATTTLLGPNFPESPLLALRRVMNGEDRSQLEFEFAMSNLPWLAARLVGKAHHSTPSEKRIAYREKRASF